MFVPTYEPAGVINARDRPRVLLWVRNSERAARFDWLEAKSGTFRRIRQMDEVDLSEWDVLVTDEPHLEIHTSQWGLIKSSWGRVPDHLYLFRVFGASYQIGRRYFEVNVDSDGHADTARALRHSSDVPGHVMKQIKDLPEPIQELVKSDLLNTVERRAKQYGIAQVGQTIQPAATHLRPFLIGPGGLMMAASYQRPRGKHVWLIPEDLSNLEAWYDVAQSEWHTEDPSAFPSVSTWQTSREWDTADERAARARLERIEVAHAKVVAEYERDRAAALLGLSTASDEAKVGLKTLLHGQGDPLQDAVSQALVHLGFKVRDMDAEWPDRERREDFRVSDPDDADWLVLADATGVAKGAPGSKISTLLSYVTKYLLDERPSRSPGIWVIVNRLVGRDPLTRGDIYREDDLEILKDSSGLAIDAPALFVLVRDIPLGAARAATCRRWLREARGQITTQDALRWLADNP